MSQNPSYHYPDARMPWGASGDQHHPRANDPRRALDLTARGLTMHYASAAAIPPALGGVDLHIGAGETVAVMGPSGSGKTTLLHVLAGIVRPTAGQVLWKNLDIARMSDGDRTRLRRNDFGFVFQQGMLLPELPAVENVALPLMIGGTGRAEAMSRAGALFAPLGLGGLESRRPGELSGGQAQRVAVARALVTRPGVVFADEPTGALDQSTSAEVMRHLTEMTRHSGASLVLVTHDPNVAAWCARTVSVRDGLVISDIRNPDRAGGTTLTGARR